MFAFSSEVAYIQINKQKFYLLHYAMRVWRSSHHGCIHLHGHSHGNLPPMDRSMDVGIMNHGYKPLELDEVMSFMEGREHQHHHGDERNYYTDGMDNEEGSTVLPVGEGGDGQVP
jgi:calcineurin-like phosphoesterase family protein